MSRRLAALVIVGVGTLAFAGSAAAYTPPETDPRIVLSTPQGDILIALAPANAPQHVAQFLAAIAAGDFDGANVVRVAPKFYVQLVGQLGSAQLSGLPGEEFKAGNVRGALSVYDSGTPGQIPTLMLVLTNSPQLDADYTAVGFVEAGISMAEAISDAPTVGDHQPRRAITISSIRVATPQERTLLRQAEQSAAARDDSTSQLAAIFIIACAAFVGAMISAFHDRLTRQRVISLALLMALLAFFAIWVALAGSDHGSGLIGVALFGGAIAVFRLMGRFERPVEATDRAPAGGDQPPETTGRNATRLLS